MRSFEEPRRDESRVFELDFQEQPPHEVAAHARFVGPSVPPIVSSRPRCADHGLLVDDRGRCSRCPKSSYAQPLRRLVIALAAVACMALLVFQLNAFRDGQKKEAELSRRNTAAAISERHGGKLVVFTATYCGACQIARSYLTSHGIEYVERSVDQDAAAQEELLSLKGRNVVPTFIVEDEVLTGFDPQGVLLERARAKHGMR